MTAIYTAAAEAKQVSGSLLHDHIDGKQPPFLENEGFSALSPEAACVQKPLGKAGHPRQFMQIQLRSPADSGLLVATVVPTADQSHMQLLGGCQFY